MLDKEGFITHAAFDVAQGLDAYYLTQPAIIMLDVKMTVMDGWETLVRLRRVSETPVIMLVVYSAKKDIFKGLEIGAGEYLVKPFGIQELVSHVTTVVRRALMVLQVSSGHVTAFWVESSSDSRLFLLIITTISDSRRYDERRRSIWSRMQRLLYVGDEILRLRPQNDRRSDD